MKNDKTWTAVGYYYVAPKDASGTTQKPTACDFCGTVIRNVYVVECDEDGVRAEIGSECCKKYTAIEDVDTMDRDMRTREDRRSKFIAAPGWPACRAGSRRKLRGYVYLLSPGKYGGFRASYVTPDRPGWTSVDGFHDTVELARAAVFDAAHPPSIPIIDPDRQQDLRLDEE